jgi:hypothetical protein
MRLSNDGLVYVCDRLANRLQAFDKMRNFSKYPPAKPGALIGEPLEAAVGSLTRPR